MNCGIYGEEDSRLILAGIGRNLPILEQPSFTPQPRKKRYAVGYLLKVRHLGVNAARRPFFRCQTSGLSSLHYKSLSSLKRICAREREREKLQDNLSYTATRSTSRPPKTVAAPYPMLQVKSQSYPIWTCASVRSTILNDLKQPQKRPLHPEPQSHRTLQSSSASRGYVGQ